MANMKLKHRRGKRKVKAVGRREIVGNLWEDTKGEMIDSQHLLISMMLPPAVKAFFAELDAEVRQICGDRYSHQTGSYRWGHQQGSIILGNQKVALQRQRVRDEATGQEVPLSTYARFQDPGIFQQAVFQDGIRHVSQRDYAKGVQKIAASFGLSKSSVSRRWIRATSESLAKLQGRDLKEMGIVAVFIDGKRFARHGAVVALGVSEDGSKHVLGIFEASSESSKACKELLDDLTRRGLPEEGLLFIVDGGSGLNKALEDKYDVHLPEKRRAVRIRCHKHKWSNIDDVLSKDQASEAKSLFWAMRDAKDLAEAKACSSALESSLKKANQSALISYLEAKPDLLAMHELKISSQLKRFFSTTNPIESVNSLTEEDMRRVKRWRDSAHFQRWLATSCLQVEGRMRKVKGYRGLAALRIRLNQLCHVNISVDDKEVAA